MTSDQLAGYLNYLNKNNNEYLTRHMAIIYNDQHVCDIILNFSSAKPLISTPSNLKEKMNLFNVECEIGKYKEYVFKENTIISLTSSQQLEEAYQEGLTPEQIENYKTSRLDTDGQSMENGRYIPYITVYNPVTRTDITIFIDKFHGDMFCVAGLNFILDQNIVLDKTTPIQMDGYFIGGLPANTTTGRVEDITPSWYFTSGGPDIQNKFNYQNLHAEDQDVQAYGIAFTKELPTNTATPNFPVIYDRLVNPVTGDSDIQLARQDSYPGIYIQIGKVRKFFKDDIHANDKKVDNWIIYGSHVSRIRLRHNLNSISDDTILGVIINLY